MNSTSKYSILLYSKYSTQSKHILDLISTSGVSFEKTVNLLCVDSRAVRARILANKKINVQYVPCILTVYSNGFVEKYDGPNAFNWIKEVISQLKPPPPPPVIIQPPTPPPPPPTPIEPVEKKKSKKQKNVTKIEELDDEDEEEDIIIKPKRKKHLILKDKGNYESDSEDEFFSSEMPGKIDKTSTSKAIKTEADMSGKVNIMSKAKELAKMRETDIKKPDQRTIE